jgi:histidinol-phosphate/aromatic aminotransferase/cobyric acid decarboxylase-like protein/short-subunit dehydrogenase
MQYVESFTDIFINNKPIILITGTTSGIGKAFVESIDKKYKILIHGRDCNKLVNMIKVYKNKGMDIEYLCYDLSKKDNITKFNNEIKTKYKKIDILINNFYDSSNEEDISYQINTNLTNTILLTKMLSKNINTGGTIINISSGVSRNVQYGNNFISTYTIIKDSIEKFTKIYSSKLYPKKISITCLRIDDSYKSKLTNKFLKNYTLKNPNEIVECLNYIISKKWNETAGKIIKSSSLINNSIVSLLDTEYNLADYDFNTLFKQDKKILGENCIGMSKNISTLLNDKTDFTKYVSYTGELHKYLASKYKVHSNNILFHKGTINFLDKIINLFVKDEHNIIISSDTWGVFTTLSNNNNKRIVKVPYKIKDKYIIQDFDRITNSISSHTRMIYLIAPIFKKDFDKFIKNISSNLIIVIDFCYNDFYPYLLNNENPIIDMGNYINSKNKIIGVNTFSKFYSLPGINFSFSIANSKMNDYIKPHFHYPVSNFIELISLYALTDAKRNTFTVNYYKNEKNRIINKLNKLKIPFYNAYQNYILIFTNKSKEKINKLLEKNHINLDIVLENNYMMIPILNRKQNDILLSIIID